MIETADADFFAQEITSLARALIGCVLLLDGVGGRIVETEAYEAGDAASHSFRGPTPRNTPMFGPAGRTYVYRIYGMHWCLNLVGGKQLGAAVLIRALEPTLGLDAMRDRRGVDDLLQLCSGPGKLCQALGVSHAHNNLSATVPPFSLTQGAAPPLSVGPRIGITKDTPRPWRFGAAGSRYLSRPFQPDAEAGRRQVPGK